jgi:hypothetical protein
MTAMQLLVVPRSWRRGEEGKRGSGGDERGKGVDGPAVVSEGYVRIYIG